MKTGMLLALLTISLSEMLFGSLLAHPQDGHTPPGPSQDLHLGHSVAVVTSYPLLVYSKGTAGIMSRNRNIGGTMESEALLTFTSHNEGKNAQVFVYSDRIEWAQGKGLSVGKLAAGLATGGLSLAVTGVRGGNQGSEMIPVKSMTSVTTEKDGLRFWKVKVIASGNTIDFRVTADDAKKVKETLTQLMLGSHASQNQPTSPAPRLASDGSVDIAEQLGKLASLRDSGVLTEEEFQSKKSDLLSRM